MIRQDIMNFKDYIETKHQSPASDYSTSSQSNTTDNPSILRTEAESVQDGSGTPNENQFNL
jgi:hypothetical protein